MTSEIIVGLLSSVPLWGLLLFFLYRTIKGRDAFERSVTKELERIKETLNGLDKAIALLAKDMSHATNLGKSVSDLNDRVSKLKIDVDAYYSRLREFERGEVV